MATPDAGHETLLQLREKHPDCHVYVLLDQNCPVADTHVLHNSNLARREVKRVQCPVQRPDFAHDPAIVPQLLLLRKSDEHGWVDEELLRATVQCAMQRCASVNGAYVAGWIFSSAAPERLARHLCEAGTIFDVSQGRGRYLPFFEPHALSLIQAHTSPADMTAWLGPAQCWCYLDLRGQMNVLQTEGDASRAWGQPSRPSAKLLAALSRRKLAKSIAARVDPQVLPSRQPELALDSMIEDAQSQGLSRTEDIVLHVLNALTLGVRWSHHPVAARAIATASNGVDAPKLSDLLDALSDEQLNELAGMMPAPR